jgi:hypothetical protein
MNPTDTLAADGGRYARKSYRRSGLSGVQLPMVSLGFWQNFGGDPTIRAAALDRKLVILDKPTAALSVALQRGRTPRQAAAGG